jgi:hypothetical protein
MEINLPLDFKEFLKLLNERNLKCLLIGHRLLNPACWRYSAGYCLSRLRRWASPIACDSEF